MKNRTSTSESANDIKVEYSLRELARLPNRILNSKIFTFDRRLTSDDLNKMNVGETLQLESIVKTLKCMHGIE